MNETHPTAKRATLSRLVLLVVLTAALLVRLPGVFWGFGLSGEEGEFTALHPDEPRFIEIARGLHEGTGFRRSYVLGMGTLLRGALAAAETAGIKLDDAGLTLAARLIGLLAGLGLVALTAALVRRLAGSSRAALMAAALVAFQPLCVIHSHFGTADMLYVLLLYAFAFAVWPSGDAPRPAGLLAAWMLAGAAAAVKFAAILVPSLAILFVAGLRPSRRGRLLGVAGLASGVFIFFALQGFQFGPQSIASRRAGLLQDNLGGFVHNKWLNPPVYAVELIRACGIPVIACSIVFALSRIRRVRVSSDAASWMRLAALLPFALHAAAINALNVPFPRHLLPLVPGIAIATALFIDARPKRRAVWAALAIAWSATLAGYGARHELSGTRRRPPRHPLDAADDAGLLHHGQLRQAPDS